MNGPATRVLVVDGWVKAAVALGYRLQALGCEVRTAHDEASALLGAALLHPQLVFIDAALSVGGRLPGMLRQLLLDEGLTIVALLAPLDDGKRHVPQACGADLCLDKPPPDAVLQQLLERSRQHDEDALPPPLPTAARGEGPRRPRR